MLFIDGNTKRSSAWIAQTSQNNPNLKIEAGRTYRFSYWASGVGETNPAKLSFWIKYNGKELPNMEELGTKTLVAIYNKTFKGEKIATNRLWLMRHLKSWKK